MSLGNPWQPAYLKLDADGELGRRIEEAYALLEDCILCPHRCRVNRLQGEKGICGGPAQGVVASYNPHFGEEAPLVGRGGSGTIFFSYCNLGCVFCQNWTIAHGGRGRQVSDEELARMMLHLQEQGCHNINLVTPTHFMPQILRALGLAVRQGLSIPLCYNTNGYERVEILRLLDGIVDIYLPDLKFMGGVEAHRYTEGATFDYPHRAKGAIEEMYRQVGKLITDDQGIALQGLMIRHLVMPNGVGGTEDFIRWVAGLSPEIYVNIMGQYRPEYRAIEYPPIARPVSSKEYLEALKSAQKAGLKSLDG
ncbi:MAG: radical SAM protein [Limnochordia bacterium]|jgi:putative pyruvate formate lyase activating enzyme